MTVTIEKDYLSHPYNYVIMLWSYLSARAAIEDDETKYEPSAGLMVLLQ